MRRLPQIIAARQFLVFLDCQSLVVVMVKVVEKQMENQRN